ncbi:FtsW/RodA/SpoVE family cell cycle protein, partial [Streptococcus sp. SPC0]|nr:FtsW/RodA/SpoVE family cell cycle protein [Streptococcus sp. SPC0]
VNIGGISGLIPSTGVTFPFLSQGGNSLLVLSVAIGFVLNIDANEKKELIMKEAEEQYKPQEKNEKIINLDAFK